MIQLGATLVSRNIAESDIITANANQAPRLSARETETLTWCARGKTREEIALILGLSARTVEFHLDNARSKLGVSTRIQAVVRAVIDKLIEP